MPQQTPDDIFGQVLKRNQAQRVTPSPQPQAPVSPQPASTPMAAQGGQNGQMTPDDVMTGLINKKKQPVPEEITADNPWAERRNIHLLGQETDVEAPEWLAGAGRGIMDVAQGVKQFGLEAGERLGMVPEGRAQDYTRQVQAEQQAYQQNYGDSTSAGVGRFAGSVIPTLPVPGGVAGGAVARAGTAAAAGGAVGATQFVPEGESRVRNALLGAGAGGAISGAMSAVGKGINALRGDTIPQAADDVIRIGQQQDVPVYYPDVAGGPIVQKGSVAMEEVPLVGMAGPRATQNVKAKEAAERLRGRLVPATGEDVGDVLQGSLKARLDKAKKISNRIYTKVATELDSAGPIPSATLNQRANALLQAELAKRPEYQDQGVIKLLQKYSVDPNYNFSGLKELRSDLLEQVSDYYKGRNTVIGTRGVHVVQDLKEALEADMEAAARNHSPKGWRDFRKASDFYRKEVVPYMEEADIRKAIKTGDADEIFNKFIQSGKGDRAARLYQRLNPEGRGALRFGLVDQAYQKAISQGPQGEIFSPARFSRELERMEPAIKKVFNPRDKAEITGLVKLMRHVQRSGQFMENPPTGNRAIQLMIGALGATGALTIPGQTAAAAGGIGALKVLFTTKAGRNLLLSSSKLRIGSDALNDLLANQLPKLGAVGAVDTVTDDQQSSAAARRGTP